MVDDSPHSVADAFDGETLPDPLPDEPFALFGTWFDEAQAAKNQRDRCIEKMMVT